MSLLAKLLATCGAAANYPLRSRSKLGAICQFAVAQVAARLVPGVLCIPFPNQTLLVVPPKMKGAAHFISPGLCEFEQMAFTAHFLRPGDLFLDVGANLGAYTLLASGVAGATGIAVEPCLGTYQSLVRTLKLNDLQDRVTPMNIALGSKTGSIQLTQGLGTENFVSTSATSQGQAEVPVATLDQVAAERTPFFLKVDVEGYESEVIAGASKTLEHLQGMIIERAQNASRYGFDESKLHGSIRSRGFKPYTYEPFKRQLKPLPNDAHGNIIYLRDEAEAAQRLREAPTFAFRGFKI